jgi:hypothetical protein
VANTVSGSSSETSYLASVQGQLWRWDLKALVGGVLFGVLMTVLGQLMERLDTALTGGAFVILGAINFYTIAALSTLLFRLPGGLITGLTNALIANASGTSPMAPWFIPTNALFAVVYAIVIWRMRMDRWQHYLIAAIVGVWLSMLIIVWGLLVTIKLPMGVALTSYVVTSIAGTVGATVLTMLIAKAVDRSRVLQ